MSASTITRTQAKGLRHQFNSAYSAVRAFSNGLYAAHGGWHPAARSAGQPRGNAQARG